MTHVPSLGIIGRYFSEMARVMTRGGVARVQVNTLRRHLSERIQLRMVASDKVPILHRKLKVRLNPPSSMGVVLSASQCRTLCADNGLELVTVCGVNEQYTWLTTRKRG